jgi:hemoglobin
MNIVSRFIAAAGFGSALLAATAADSATTDKTLYQRIGGYDAIAAVTDDLLGRLAADQSLGRFFVGFSTDSFGKVRAHFIEIICVQTGGPCNYTGRDMKTVHTGLHITKADWQHSLELFGQTMAKFDVPEQEQKDLAALLVPLEKDIVEQK